MGRRVIRRGSPIVWALLLAGPALVLAFLGYRSVEQADRIRRREATDAARAAADTAFDTAVRRLETIRAREEARPYYEYQSRFMPADVTGVGPAFVQNSYQKLRGDALMPDAWFRYSYSQGRTSGPEAADLAMTGMSASFLRHYDSALRERLESTAKSHDWVHAATTSIPLEVLAANEEIGQLLEEVEVSQKEGRQTAYLQNFGNRVQQRGSPTTPRVSVNVRSTPIRYLSTNVLDLSDELRSVPILVAWRVVWIPGGEATGQRDAPVDRWYLVGYSFVHPLGPEGWPTPPSSGPYLYVGHPYQPGYVPSEWTVRRLTDRLAIERAPTDDPLLRVVAGPSDLDLDAERSDDRTRYLWTAAGLLSVVAVGLYVLFRSVRREVDAARRKQDFVAAVTHELKTPLAGIRMYADMLKEGWVPEGETTGTYADRIVNETKRLANLVDQVLDFSSFERGVTTFQPVLGDLGIAVREAVELSTPAAREAGVPVRVEVEAGLAPVSFDGTLVRPLVVNLVDNAIKYSARSDTKDVVVAVRRDGAHVALSVADRGVGIAAADRTRVFEPFFRSGDEMTRTARGVGIGLALVERYAKAHGALIELESEVDRGTKVTVRFPATPTR